MKHKKSKKKEQHRKDADNESLDLDALTKLYQENIRNSPIYNTMVRKFGKTRADELLKEFRAVRTTGFEEETDDEEVL